MRALVADGRGGTELRELDEPSPAPGQAVVQVRATSLNRGDVRGVATAGDGWRPGWDVAGVITQAAGDGSGPLEGTRVVGLSPGGAWAEKVAISTHLVAPIHDELSFSAAAALPVAGLTALRTLHVGGVVQDRRVVVTGASGGVGRFAVQIASHEGADVTAVVSRPERGSDLERLGAARVHVGMPEEGEFDIILESVGGPSLAAALDLVAPHGTIVSFGNSSGEATTFHPSRFYPRSGARLCAFVLLPELERLGSGARDLAYLAGLAAGGHLEASIDLELSWTEAGKAVAALLARQVEGKAVLLLD